MPTPLAGGQENSFAPQMIFLWPPAMGVGKLKITHFKVCINLVENLNLDSVVKFKVKG